MSEPTLPPRPHRTSGRHIVRVLVPVGTVALALGGVAIAEAAIDSGVDTPHDLAERGLGPANPSVDDTVIPPSTDAATPVSDTRTEAFEFATLPDGTTQTFVAGAAGTVTIARNGSTLTVVAVGANPGWVTEIEQQSGPEVEVVFRNGTARIDLEAEFEDGAVRVRVRERTDAVDEDEDDDVTPPPTTPTIRVDNSGPGSVNSGPGSVDSRRDGDDDGPDHEDDDSGSHSGSGSSGSGSSGSGSSGSGSSGSGGSGSGSGSSGPG